MDEAERERVMRAYLDEKRKERDEAAGFRALGALSRQLEREQLSRPARDRLEVASFADMSRAVTWGLAGASAMQVAIYGLRDPDPLLVLGKREIRYVGATAQNPMRRFGQHIEEARGGGRNEKAKWLRSLHELPQLIVLERVLVMAEKDPFRTDGRDVIAEQKWIDALRARGHRLTNTERAGGIAPRESA